jgi:type 1 glutamine amidotransferase
MKYVFDSSVAQNGIGLAMKLTAILSMLLLSFVAAAQPGDKKAPPRVLLISGAAEYDTDKTLPILKKYLEAKAGCTCILISAKGDADLPGLENLDQCDAAVLYTRRLKLQGDQLDRLKKYCTAGKPLVGIRTASHAIQTWLEFDKEVLGGNYKNHYKAGPLTEVKIEAKDHPILKGVTPYQSQASLYRNTGLSKDVDILLTGSIPEASEPIAWTRAYKGGRIFYTSLGHQKDFEEDGFLRLIANAVLWTTHREMQIK